MEQAFRSSTRPYVCRQRRRQQADIAWFIQQAWSQIRASSLKTSNPVGGALFIKDCGVCSVGFPSQQCQPNRLIRVECMLYHWVTWLLMHVKSWLRRQLTKSQEQEFFIACSSAWACQHRLKNEANSHQDSWLFVAGYEAVEVGARLHV